MSSQESSTGTTFSSTAEVGYKLENGSMVVCVCIAAVAIMLGRIFKSIFKLCCL